MSLEVELRVNAKEGIGGDGAFKKLRERESDGNERLENFGARNTT